MAGEAPPSLQDRAAVMLQNRIGRGAAALEADADAVVSAVIELAIARGEDRPAPIYVVGLGGSGSHWLTGMLDAILPVINLEEAPIPADFAASIESLPVEEQGFAVDCLYLSHASAHVDVFPGDLTEARFLHSAMRVIEPRHREWDPECFAIYLLRDPRDQAACFAFRKREFRQRHYGSASDERYLAGCALNNVGNYSEMRLTAARPNFVCRYEELEESAPEVLQRLAAAIGYPVEPQAAAQAAREHDALLMRSGALPRKGNLFNEASLGWRKETSQRQKLILHSLLVDVVTDAEYPADDCLGQPLEMRAQHNERQLRFRDAGELGVLFTRDALNWQEGTWTRLGEARGTIVAPRGANLKLRVHESATREAIAHLATLSADDLSSLCLAGNRHLDDGLLTSLLSALAGLEELDISRTAATDAVLPVLAELPHLRGVSLFESEVTQRGASTTLRNALGSSVVLGPIHCDSADC
jgi:hypothetical protein